MNPKPGPGQQYGQGYKYVSLGLTFAGGIIMFMAAGLGLDRWLGLTPLFTISGTLIGAVLSFVSVYRRLMADEAKDKAAKAAKSGEAGR
jgi:F0F1-type ATP synthase assembly protein I